MIARDFALYDTLNCSAMAVDEDGSGRPALAEAALLEAQFAASGLFAPGSREDAAIGVIIAASAPARDWSPGRAALWSALNAASLAVLTAIGEEGCPLQVALHDALAAARLLPSGQRDAVTVILSEVRRMAGAGSEVVT